jgi:hypothetical protein
MLRERKRAYRDLHDGVLQTLEALNRRGMVTDSWARSEIAREAVWLRRLISDEIRDPATDVVGQTHGWSHAHKAVVAPWA